MRRRVTIAGIATAALLAGGGYASYAVGSDAASYRTAVATTGDVESVLSLAGTVQPAGRADLSFATAGTVAKVTVAAGDRVKAGDVLGRLDTWSLANAVTQAQARLASARARLASDKDSQSDAVAEAAEQKSAANESATNSSTKSSQTDGPVAGGGGGSGDNPGADASLAGLAAEQAAVIGAQSTASAAIVDAKAVLAQQQEICAGAFQGAPDGSGGKPDSEDGAAGASTAEESAADRGVACVEALDAVQAAQDEVSAAQDSLQTALTKLSGTLTDASKALEAAAAAQPTSTQPTPTQPTPTQPAAESPAAESPTGSSPDATRAGSVTAATLASDQASIEQAEADLLAAQQELAMAVVKAPFDGKVARVDVARGDSVTAGTTAYVLVSEGTMTAEVAATIEQVQQLVLGQVARVTPTGATEPITGVVSGIGTLADEDGNYPVTITLDTKTGLATGLTAAVEVVIGTAKDVVTVPASAVDAGSVRVLDDGVVSRIQVTAGVVGATTVEIAEGLEKGDQVVLADLSEPLPSGDSSSDQLGPGGFGGPGGTVRFGGGGGGPQVFMQRG